MNVENEKLKVTENIKGVPTSSIIVLLFESASSNNSQLVPSFSS